MILSDKQKLALTRLALRPPCPHRDRDGEMALVFYTYDTRAGATCTLCMRQWLVDENGE